MQRRTARYEGGIGGCGMLFCARFRVGHVAMGVSVLDGSGQKNK